MHSSGVCGGRAPQRDVHLCVCMPACAVSCGPGACARDSRAWDLATCAHTRGSCCCLYRNSSCTSRTAYRLNAPTRETYLLCGRYHRRFFGVRQVRGRVVGIRELSPRVADLHWPSYLCTTPRLLALLIAGVSRTDQSTAEGGGRQESTTGLLHMWPSPHPFGHCWTRTPDLRFLSRAC